MSKKKAKKDAKLLFRLFFLPLILALLLDKEPWDLRKKNDETYFEDPDGLDELIPPALRELVDSWKRPREFTKPPGSAEEAAEAAKVNTPKSKKKKGKKPPPENVALPCKLGDTILRTIAHKLDARNRIAGKLLSQFYAISNLNEAVPEGCFLWESIYPRASEKEGGFCRYNPYGKYIVRLYVSGAWRRVVIDDRIPFNVDGECLFPTSSEITEIWPTLLAKALFKLQSRAATGNLPGQNASPPEAEDPCILHWTTGWLVEPIRVARDDFWERVEASVEVQGRAPSPTVPPIADPGAEDAEAEPEAPPEEEQEKEKLANTLTLVCARPSFKDVGLGQVCAVLGAREKGNTREVLIRGTLNKYFFVDLLKSQFDALIEEPEPPAEDEAEAEAENTADAKPSPPENSVSLAKVVDMLRDEDVQMVLARTGLPESQIVKYEQVVEEAQDLDEEVPSYTWEQLAEEAISLRPALWVNVNDIGRFFLQSALAFTQRSAKSIQLHNHWRWEPIPEVKKEKKGEEETQSVATNYTTVGDLRAMSLRLEPAPLLYVDGGEEGATVRISLITDAVTEGADPEASWAVLTVLDESLDPTDPDSRALSSRVESRVTCNAGSVSGSRLLVPPGKHFYSFSLAAPGGSVVAVQSEAEALFTSPVNVIRQVKQDLHVFSISGNTAETDGWSVASWHSFTCTQVTSVKVILHVVDPMVVRMVGLRIVDHATGRVSVLPTLNTPFWEAKATPEGYSVVVVLDSKATRRGGIKDLPSTEWNLDIITDVPVQGLSTDVKTNPFLKLKETETDGGYRPNKYLRLFRQLVTLLPPGPKDNNPWPTRLLCQVQVGDAMAHVKLEVIVPSDDADQSKDQVLCVVRGRGEVELLSWSGPARQTVVLQASLDASRYTPAAELFSQVPFIQFDVDDKSSKNSKKKSKKSSKGKGGKGKDSDGKGGKGKGSKKGAGKDTGKAAGEKKKVEANISDAASVSESEATPVLKWRLRAVSNGTVTIEHDTAKEVAYEAIRKSWDEGNSSRSEQARVSRMRYLGEHANPPKGSSDQDVGTFPWDQFPEVSAVVMEADAKQRVIAEDEKVALREKRTAALKVSSEKLEAMNTEREKSKKDKEARVKKLRALLKNPGGDFAAQKSEAWVLRVEAAKVLLKEEKERVAKLEELTKAASQEKKTSKVSHSRKKKK